MKPDNFYKDIFEISSPYKHQIDVWEKSGENQKPLLLRAPTGSGKTEAVLAPFLNQFIENSFTIAPRLIYTLPMRALVNSVAERIEKHTQNLELEISVEIQHGDVSNAPFFISDIVVTTLDQFLYGFARSSKQVGRHIDIPAGAIASSLVVFDEAHMYRDGFTFSIMRALMEILHKSNIPFVVMTATMPKALERSLFENINDYEIVNVDKFNLNNSASIAIKNEPIYTKYEGININNELLNKIRNRKTLIVLNQVERAQKVYEKVKASLDNDEENNKSDDIVLLHSRFTREDRKRHENKAKGIMESKENKPRIVVSTQVLEAGMDFSAELLITEIAPADSIVQRAGRCARYREEKGEIIIFPVEDEKGHLPYEKEQLERTRKWLEENQDFNIKDFKKVCAFVDILNYKANDFEAKDTLIDLYECVLYADTRPSNIQLRDDKPVYLVVVNLAEGKGKDEKERIRNVIENTNMKENSISVRIQLAWKYYKDKVLQFSIDYDVDKKSWEHQEIKEIYPFKYYAIDRTYYNVEKGIIRDGFI